MSEGGAKKRKSKAWYRKQAYHNKRMKKDEKPGRRLTAGLKGFIVTCSKQESEAVMDAINILTEYADRLYGPETKAEAQAVDSEDSDGDDIEAAIAKEVQALKETTAKGERRFQNSKTGAKNCIFIRTMLDDPVGLAHAIFTDLRQSKQQKSRYALRLLPVVGTCTATVKEITNLAKVVLQPFFTDTKLEVTFTITFKARNNNGVGRDMIISTLRQTIMDTFPSVLLRFTHFNPQITVFVEVMCGVACIAVAKDFAAFRKYNLLEVVRDEPAECSHGAESENTARMQDEDSENVDEKPAECSHGAESENTARMQDEDSENVDEKPAKCSHGAESENTARIQDEDSEDVDEKPAKCSHGAESENTARTQDEDSEDVDEKPAECSHGAQSENTASIQIEDSEDVDEKPAECSHGAQSENTSRTQDEDHEDVDAPGSQLEEANEVS